MQTIQIFQEDIPVTKIDNKVIDQWVKDLIKNENKSTGEISIIFCSDVYLLEINKKFLNHNYYTDIITFDYSIKEVISGDLFISWERVTDNAKKLEIEFDKELYRVIFHGILHLLGYKDKDTKDKEIMVRKEDYYLERFGLLNI